MERPVKVVELIGNMRNEDPQVRMNAINVIDRLDKKNKILIYALRGVVLGFFFWKKDKNLEVRATGVEVLRKIDNRTAKRIVKKSIR